MFGNRYVWGINKFKTQYNCQQNHADEVINENMIKCETFGSIFGNVFLHPHTTLLIITKQNYRQSYELSYDFP